MAWVTNDETAAMLLRAADRMYERALARAETLPLVEKVVAISSARQIRDAAYKMAATGDVSTAFKDEG